MTILSNFLIVLYYIITLKLFFEQYKRIYFGVLFIFIIFCPVYKKIDIFRSNFICSKQVKYYLANLRQSVMKKIARYLVNVIHLVHSLPRMTSLKTEK